MTRLSSQHLEFINDFDLAWADAVMGVKAGHMGSFEFAPAPAMPIWAKFLEDNHHKYYAPVCEPEVIAKAAPVSAAFVGNQPVTFVSRGPGTKFKTKEACLAAHIPNIVKFIYIDENPDVLDLSMAEGKSLFPHARHQAIQHDMFDPALRYDIEGREVSALFGLTLANLAGHITDGAPQADYVEKVRAIYSQMAPGAHFIVTGDTNQDSKTIEESYAGQGDFARHMLTYHGIHLPVKFVVAYHPQSYMLAHYFKFTAPAQVNTVRGSRFFHQGDAIHFNSSMKCPADVQINWTEKAGFRSLFAPDRVLKDSFGRLAFYHFTKPVMMGR
ncbi:MAG: L-histidine N(alpha)-methyltransferase [Alphaproteobacteria bacterium]|nr:L-histidine N(alpha)-methyltransferase [Alphaproteobacteria bacterium]